MCRKKGKLPPPTIPKEYDLEYGSETIEMNYGKGEVVVVDDVLATGGTIQAVNELAKEAGYNVIGNIVLIDLKFVPRVDNYNIDVKSVVNYE